MQSLRASLFTVFIFFSLSQLGFSVVRPDFSWHYKPRVNLSDVTVGRTGEGVVKARKVGGDFGAVKVLKTDETELSYITAQQCCKVGESLVRKVNSCKDASLRSNTLIKGKRKIRRQEIAEGLAVEVSRCQQHQHLLHKCCLNRLHYVIALEACDFKLLWEKYKCRRSVKSRYRQGDSPLSTTKEVIDQRKTVE